MGILGKESYNLDQAEPRNVLGYLQGPIEPGGFVQDLSWTAGYRNLRQAAVILAAVDKVSTYTNAQKEGYSRLREDGHGDGASDAGPHPRRRRGRWSTSRRSGGTVRRDRRPDAALTRISALLDEAKTHLQAGGTAFPFALHSGFNGFNTPATFLQFNRGIKARTEVYRKQWALGARRA